MGWDDSGLSTAQAAFVAQVLPGASMVADESWGLLDTRVLHVRNGAGEHTVKASGPENTHFPRELTAHRQWTGALLRGDDTGRLVAADAESRVLVLERVPGHLALGTPDETAATVHRQAGTILRRLHDQAARTDAEYLTAETAKALRSLDAPHRIDPQLEDRARTLLRSSTPHAATLVPTHGDWHPRNWIVQDGRLRAIDFGRFGFRPAAADLTRLAVLHWEDSPELEHAFFAGYGSDPRDTDDWRWLQLREAVGTAVWAFTVHDERFERQGHRMLENALAAF